MESAMGKSIILIDNYDSFTYNVAHLIRTVSGDACSVVRNDAVVVDELSKYTHIVLSPGPGIPSEAGKMPQIVQRYAEKIPMLGICLGHQCIGEAFGAKLKNLSAVVHGVARDTIVQQTSPLFMGLPPLFKTGRYHSWVVDTEEFPPSLRITATDPTGAVMALEHNSFPLFGVQFHPESVLTEHGAQIMKNFLEISL